MPGDDVLDESRKFEIGQIGSHGTASSSAHLAGSLRAWICRAAYAMVRLSKSSKTQRKVTDIVHMNCIVHFAKVNQK
jgi:hypothetical protein